MRQGEYERLMQAVEVCSRYCGGWGNDNALALVLKLDAMEVSKKEGNVGLTGAAQGYSEVQAPVECYDVDVDAGSKLGISTQTAAVANATSLAVFRTHTKA